MTVTTDFLDLNTFIHSYLCHAQIAGGLSTLRWLHIPLGSTNIDVPAAQFHFVQSHSRCGQLLGAHLYKPKAACTPITPQTPQTPGSVLSGVSFGVFRNLTSCSLILPHWNISAGNFCRNSGEVTLAFT